MDQRHFVMAVVLQRDALHVDEATAVLQGLHPLGNGGCQHGQRKVFAREFAHGLSRALRERQRLLDVAGFL